MDSCRTAKLITHTCKAPRLRYTLYTTVTVHTMYNVQCTMYTMYHGTHFVQQLRYILCTTVTVHTMYNVHSVPRYTLCTTMQAKAQLACLVTAVRQVLRALCLFRRRDNPSALCQRQVCDHLRVKESSATPPL